MLKQGDTIGVFSSSYPFTAVAPKATESAVQFFENAGYRVKMGTLTGKRDHYRSGTAQERAEEVNELICDPEISCIMASGGGMVSNALLPYLDYKALKVRPKMIVGHSDITALLLGIYQKTGLITYYGPNFVTTFGQTPPFQESSLFYMEQGLGRKTPFVCQKPNFFSDEITSWEKGVMEKEKKPNQWVTVRPGIAEGRLLGGNLNTISGMMGSPYMPEFRQGDILFLEDTEKFAAHAERYFTMLKLCGVFDLAGGIVLGKHRQFDDQGTGKNWADILQEVLGKRELPILADVDCCHTIPMMTLPIGGRVYLDSEKQEITILKNF